jgi:hypothetical protein
VGEDSEVSEGGESPDELDGLREELQERYPEEKEQSETPQSGAGEDEHQAGDLDEKDAGERGKSSEEKDSDAERKEGEQPERSGSELDELRDDLAERYPAKEESA